MANTTPMPAEESWSHQGSLGLVSLFGGSSTRACCRTWAQDLPADERPRACLQLLVLPTPGPGESCYDRFAECRSVPCGGTADHPASHGDEVAHAGHHQVGRAQERAPLEQRDSLDVRRRTHCTLADLASILCLLCRVPWATGALCPTKRAPLPIGWSDSV